MQTLVKTRLARLLIGLNVKCSSLIGLKLEDDESRAVPEPGCQAGHKVFIQLFVYKLSINSVVYFLFNFRNILLDWALLQS